MSAKHTQSQTNKFPFLLLSISLVSVAVQVFMVQPAKANCVYAEEAYPTGATRGSYVCMPDGSWQQQ